jgi:hypothetical protein
MNSFCSKILVCFIIFLTIDLNAQEANEEAYTAHSITILIGHTQISQGIQENGNRKWLSLPSWSLNYNYFFNREWAVGLHSDIIVEDFQVEEHLKSGSDKIIERSYPISTALMASYKPLKHFSFLAGLGGEFAENDNFLVARIGVDYSMHINKSLELTASVTNDFKFNAYNAWNIGVGITKIIK